MFSARTLSAAFLTVSIGATSSYAQDAPSWESYEWDGGGTDYDFLRNHSCALIPFPPVLWLPDCTIRETESGDFLIYNQLLKEREVFGYDDIPYPAGRVDTDYHAFRA